jgi:hypothetical protein
MRFEPFLVLLLKERKDDFFVFGLLRDDVHLREIQIPRIFDGLA